MADSEWVRTKDRLVQTMRRFGFREELGMAVAQNLGSPKAMERMISYLVNVKPKTEELVVDEMLAICSEVAAWREKKASEKKTAVFVYCLRGARSRRAVRALSKMGYEDARSIGGTNSYIRYFTERE